MWVPTSSSLGIPNPSWTKRSIKFTPLRANHLFSNSRSKEWTTPSRLRRHRHWRSSPSRHTSRWSSSPRYHPSQRTIPYLVWGLPMTALRSTYTTNRCMKNLQCRPPGRRSRRCHASGGSLVRPSCSSVTAATGATCSNPCQTWWAWKERSSTIWLWWSGRLMVSRTGDPMIIKTRTQMIRRPSWWDSRRTTCQTKIWSE